MAEAQTEQQAQTEAPERTQRSTQRTLEQFIDAHGLSMTVEPAAGNPNADDWNRIPGSRHWCCVIARRGPAAPGLRNQMSVPFSQG
jgi:hypothetical protein